MKRIATLGIFLSVARLGTGTSYMRVTAILKSICPLSYISPTKRHKTLQNRVSQNTIPKNSLVTSLVTIFDHFVAVLQPPSGCFSLLIKLEMTAFKVLWRTQAHHREIFFLFLYLNIFATNLVHG